MPLISILILPLLSAILLNISFTYLNLFIIPWFALTPYFLCNLLIQKTSAILILNFAFGFSFYFLNLLWLRFISYWSIPPLAIYFSIYYIIFGLIILAFKKLARERTESLFLFLPFLWVA
jgi:hypothetical protein